MIRFGGYVQMGTAPDGRENEQVDGHG